MCLSAVSASRRCTLCITQLPCKRKRQSVCCFVLLYCFNWKYGLLTRRKPEVKIAGYWPSSFLACLSTKAESRSINTQKKELFLRKGTGPISSKIFTELAWSIKDLSSGKRTLFSCGTQPVVTSKQDSVIFTARVANPSAGFGLSCPQ